jgi:hypothetical protein
MAAAGLALAVGMSGESYVEEIKQADDDDPEYDLGGNAFLLDDLFVQLLVAHT